MKEKSFEKREELLDAALREFTKRDYENASLNTIIKNAGVSKGSFYYHFKDKEDLFLHLLEVSSQQKMAFVLSSQVALPNKDDTLFDNIKKQARLGAEFGRKYPLLHQLGKTFLKTRGTSVYHKAKKKLGEQTGHTMTTLAQKAIADGDIDRRFSADFVGNILTLLIMHYDELFDKRADQKLNRMVSNLDMLMDFMQTGLKNENAGKPNNRVKTRQRR